MIKINDQFTINKLKDSIALHEWSISQKGKPIITRSRYYQNIEQAFNHLIDIAGVEALENDEIKSLEILIDEIRSLKKDIHAALASKMSRDGHKTPNAGVKPKYN